MSSPTSAARSIRSAIRRSTTCKEHGREIGFNKPFQYYVASGSLSAVLDNAPTYLNFLTLAESSVIPTEVKAQSVMVDAAGRNGEREVLEPWLRNPENHVGGSAASRFILAVSLGSVFFGAMTYIGNGPNFMVKSIAGSAKDRTPTFFGYVFKFSLPILLLCGWLFL